MVRIKKIRVLYLVDGNENVVTMESTLVVSHEQIERPIT